MYQLKKYLLIVLLSNFSIISSQNITISTGTTSNVSSSTSGGVVTYSLTNTGANGVLNVNDIQTQLNAGNSVTVNATQDLTVSNALTWTSGNKLTLIAGNGLLLDADINSSTGNGAVELQGEVSIRVANLPSIAGTVTISTGSGDITIVSDWIAFDGGSTFAGNDQTIIRTTGTLSILPFNNNFSAETMGGSDGSTGSTLDWTGTLSGGHFTVTDDFRKLTIENYSNLGGLVLGKTASTHPVFIGSNIGISGPISIYGGAITLGANISSTANGDVLIQGRTSIVALTTDRTISNGSGDVTLISDYLTQFDKDVVINSTGHFTFAPFNTAWTNYGGAFNFNGTLSGGNFTGSSDAAGLSIQNVSGLTGLTIGKTDMTTGIISQVPLTVAGPITFYGGTITLDANLTTTNNGDISIHTDNPTAGLGTPRTITAAGAFKYIPRGTTFSADVTYPIANLTATSTGLTIGNATNDKNITIDADVTGGAGIELYGNNVNINSNLTTTGTSAIMHLKGNTTIAAGKTITSGGNFTHDGNLLFKSDATGTAAFGTLGGTFTTVSGLATTERYVPSKRGWRLLAAPLKGTSNTTVSNNWQGVNDEGLLFFSPSTYQSQAMTGYTTGGGMPNIWKYDSVTTQWQSIPNLTTENLFTSTGNNGFLVFATGPSNSTNIASGATETTLRPEGQLITGNVTHSLTADKYHLIGNPYASAIDTEAMVQANSGTKVFMVDPSLGTVGGYFTYDGSNWAPTEPALNDKNIQSGQGFFVRSTSNTTFVITESDKVVGNSNTWFARSGSNVSEDTSTDKLRVLLYKQVDSQWQLADGILAVNSVGGNDGVDAVDTGKMTNFNENIAFRNGTSTLAIEYRGLPTIGTIQPMRLTGTTVQPYQLRVKTENYSNSDLQPYVEDTQTGVLTLIPIDGSEVVVHFTGIAATTTAPDSRFRIVYPSTLSSDDPTTSLSVGIYPNPVEDKMFTIVLANQDETTQYTLTNLLGQQVQQGKLDMLQNTVSVVSLQGGVYVLQVVQSGKTFTTKLIIK